VALNSDPQLFHCSQQTQKTKRLLCVQTSSEVHPASYPMGTGGPFPGAKRDRGVTLTTHPHLLSRSRMSRSYNSAPLPLAPAWHLWDSFAFALFTFTLHTTVRYLLLYIRQYVIVCPQWARHIYTFFIPTLLKLNAFSVWFYGTFPCAVPDSLVEIGARSTVRHEQNWIQFHTLAYTAVSKLQDKYNISSTMLFSKIQVEIIKTLTQVSDRKGGLRSERKPGTSRSRKHASAAVTKNVRPR
jgi:hypothetical protein